jgi:hypothetical protein
MEVMSFEQVNSIISALNAKYQAMYDEMKQTPRTASMDEMVGFMCSFDKDYESYWNNFFSEFSKEQRDTLRGLIDEACELKMAIYFCMGGK